MSLIGEYSLGFKCRVINEVIPFYVLMRSEYCTLDNDLSYAFPKRSFSCFCPFHDNFNTKAAKLYDGDGGQRIYCFSEARVYRPCDLLFRGIVEISVNALFSSLWSKLDNDVKASLVSLYSDNAAKEDFVIDEGSKLLAKEFSDAKISLQDFICSASQILLNKN